MFRCLSRTLPVYRVDICSTVLESRDDHVEPPTIPPQRKRCIGRVVDGFVIRWRTMRGLAAQMVSSQVSQGKEKRRGHAPLGGDPATSVGICLRTHDTISCGLVAKQDFSSLSCFLATRPLTLLIL
jgi:hypothetical protein